MLRGVEAVGGVVKRLFEALGGVGRLKVWVGLYPLHLQKTTVIAINLTCYLLPSFEVCWECWLCMDLVKNSSRETSRVCIL